MIDVTTRKPLQVLTDETAGPYIMVPLSQLPDLERLLEEHDLQFSVDENAISLDDEPYIAIVNLARESDPAIVQSVLDSER